MPEPEIPVNPLVEDPAKFRRRNPVDRPSRESYSGVMALARERMIDRMLASDPAYDGRFLTGVLTTGIYCLPSCRARKPKPENVRFFDNPESALRAGLRPCKRCRPDDFYQRYDPDQEIVETLIERMRRAPASFAGIEDLERVSGLGSSKLHELFRLHFHATPAQILGRARVEAAQRLLLTTDRPVADVAFEVGYEGLSTFNENFRRLAAMTPAAYRRLLGAAEFRLTLPHSYSTAPAPGDLGGGAGGPPPPGRGARGASPCRCGGRAWRPACGSAALPRCCGRRSAPARSARRSRPPAPCRRTRRRGPTPISSACWASTAIPLPSSARWRPLRGSRP